MVPQASHSQKLPTPLPTPKPPTPPKEQHITEFKHNYLNQAVPKESRAKAASKPTPESSIESPNTSTVSRKKVNWPDNDERNSSPVVEPLPASGERKPIKSILKPYNGVNVSSFNLAPSKLSPAHAYPNLAAMLDSITHQLEGDDRNSKMDAYTALSGSIKASENVPEIRALKDRMGSLLKCMRRDLTAKTSTGSWDTSLIVNDLILLSSFLHKTAIAEALPADFCGYVVDHAIKTFQDPGMSKDVVKHLMFILAYQRFSPKIMNADRVGKLINALHEIEEFVKGKSIVTSRIDIYKNLIRTSKLHMLANHIWVEDLFNGMLSTLRETRASAIEFGLESAFVFGTEPKVSRAVMELFQREVGKEPTIIRFADYYAARLKEIIQQKGEGASNVPRIWSVPVLFLRCRPRQFENWAFMSPWLKVLQDGFNSSDYLTKLEANIAWGRLVFAIGPDEKTSPALVSILARPVCEQLKRKSKSMNTSKVRRLTLSGICFLLYYSLKPNSTPAQLDMYWDAYVKEIVGRSLTPKDISENPELARQDLLDACIIMKSIFDCTTPRPWKETRALDFVSAENTTMTANELPAIDSKWLRKSASKVFSVLEPLLSKLFWDLSEDKEIATSLFGAYITSIASPSAKEIKVPNETMACVAEIFNFLYRIWQAGPCAITSLSPTNSLGVTDFLGSFGNVIQTAIYGLGPLPFTEKLLSIGNKDTFVVIATPSHRPKTLRGEIQCPLHHLFILLTTICPGLSYDRHFSQMVRQILNPFFEARPSSKARMDLIIDLLPLLPSQSTEPCKMIWQVLADFAGRAIDTRDGTGSNGNNDQPLGTEYRNALKILKHGVAISPAKPLPEWRSLFEVFVTSSTIDAGDSGRAIAVIEPLAEVLSPKDGKGLAFGYAYCSMLVMKATYPKDRQALDAARRKMWGVANNHKISGCDPYSHLYWYLRHYLVNSYSSFTKGQGYECVDILDATTSLLTRCPDSVFINVLEKLQQGIGCWVLDSEAKLAEGHSWFSTVANLWTQICSRFPIAAHSYNQTKLLGILETLVSSGLESKHKTIVTSTISLWNSTFGTCEDNLEYPTRVADILLRLRPIADLDLPSFPRSLEAEVSADHRQPPTFPESQEDGVNFIRSTNLDLTLPLPAVSDFSHHRSSSLALLKAIRPSPTVRPRDQTPEFSKKKSNKRVSTPRLRHDDSQIQFETIESSPLVDAILDSQVLTDRQKEVKERQKAEAAAMFPDIHSTPLSKINPVQRRISSASTNGGLPLHRSASKARLSAPPTLERQTTPEPLGEFDAFLHSSPTPTRSLQASTDNTDPPSSPPDSPEQRIVGDLVPSSPPEQTSEPRFESTTSYEQPAAQINPFDRTISTFDFTSEGDIDMLNTSTEPQDTLHVAKAKEPILSENGTNVVESKLAPVPQAESVSSQVPSTPTRLNILLVVEKLTPKTPVFHDAHESPIIPSSDRQTVEDNFEDAVSSPRLHHEQNKSSPFSEFDQSGVMKLMANFDQGSGRPKKASKSERDDHLIVDKEPHTSTENSRNSSRNDPQDRISIESKEVEVKDSAPCKVQVSSSLASLIPETPGMKVSKEWIIVDGEEYNPGDTIVVDVPDDIEDYPKPSRKRKFSVSPRKRYSVFVEIPSRKKLKTEGGYDIEDLVPDSQLTNSQESQPKKLTPIKKRKSRGWPSRSSTTPSQIEASQQSELTDSFSFTDDSANLNVSTQSQVNQESAAGKSTLYGKGREAADGANVDEEMVDIEHGEVEGSHIGEKVARKEISPIQSLGEVLFNSMDTEEEEKTSRESRIGVAGDGPTKPEADCLEDRVMENILEAATDRSGELAQTKAVQTDTSMQTEVVPETITSKSMAKSYLENIFKFFSGVALTKEEAASYEDQLDDAKEQLFGAKRRGRELNSS